mmetsp:Transcript_31838/g.93535  ORF Transcript_31838/g.93535 Transcript_31838/m.93535 type:complete len:157 (+) Transcript_31838:1279-1749(+)
MANAMYHPYQRHTSRSTGTYVLHELINRTSRDRPYDTRTAHSSSRSRSPSTDERPVRCLIRRLQEITANVNSNSNVNEQRHHNHDRNQQQENSEGRLFRLPIHPTSQRQRGRRRPRSENSFERHRRAERTLHPLALGDLFALSSSSSSAACSDCEE